MKKTPVSIRVSRWPLALTGLIVFVAHSSVPSAPDVCSLRIGNNPYVRNEHETYLIASVLDTVRVRIPDVPSALEWSKRYPYPDSIAVFGQIVRVRSAYGAHADAVLARIAAGDSAVVLIQYSINPMCQTAPARPWLDTGFVYHFTVFLRPDSEWSARRPTFDIKMVYSFGVYPEYVRRMHNVDLDTMLTADEYASLVKALPIGPHWSQDCPSGLTRLATWAQSHEPLSELYPANAIIRMMQWQCGVRREP
jgi:hypothetical protein